MTPADLRRLLEALRENAGEACENPDFDWPPTVICRKCPPCVARCATTTEPAATLLGKLPALLAVAEAAEKMHAFLVAIRASQHEDVHALTPPDLRARIAAGQAALDRLIADGAAALAELERGE